MTTIGGHLAARLRELGVEHVFGVPGDYNMKLADELIAAGLTWVGTANELGAAYAADGYARTRGLAALLTTYGVGELSALNAIAGSYAECVPVVAITGMPPTPVLAAGPVVHHSFGDGDMRRFQRMFAEVTAHSEVLAANPAAVDHALRACVTTRRPVYLGIPADVAVTPVEPAHGPLAEVPASALTEFAEHAGKVLAGATRVALLAGHGPDRHRARAELNLLARRVPTATLVMGKGGVDESGPGFVGLYAGAASAPEVLDAIENADCLITAGIVLSDLTSGGFTHRFAPPVIDVGVHQVRVEQTVHPVPVAAALRCLASLAPELPAVRAADRTHPPFWQHLQDFLRPGDVLLADVGTASLGAAALRLPSGADLISAPLWGSMGHVLPSVLGSALAAPGRRHVAVIGDGSFQMTAQELGTLLRHRLTPVIFVLDNGGYAAERAITGQEHEYNDIAPWDYSALPAVLGDPAASVGLRASTPDELPAVFAAVEANPDKLVLVTVTMGRADIPPLLAELFQSVRAGRR